MNNPFSSTDAADEREKNSRDDAKRTSPDGPATDAPPEETPRRHASSYRVIDRPADHRIDEVVQLLTDPANGVVTQAGAIAVVKRQTEQEIHGFVKELDTLLRQRETALIGIDHNTPMLRTLATHVGLTLAVAPHNQEHVSTLCRHLTALVDDDRVSGLGSARRFEVPVSPEIKAQESSRVLDALENLRGDPLHHIGNDDWDFVAFTAPQEWASAAEETLSAFAPVIDQVVWDRPRITVCGFVFEDTEVASDNQAESSIQIPTNGNQSGRATSSGSSRNGSQSTDSGREHRSVRTDPSSTAEQTDLTPTSEGRGAPIGTSAAPEPATPDTTTQDDSPDTPPPTGEPGAPPAESDTSTSGETSATTSDGSRPPESASDAEENPTLPGSSPTGEQPSPAGSAPAEAPESEHTPDSIPSPPSSTEDDPTESPEFRPTPPSSDPHTSPTDEERFPQSNDETDASTFDDSQAESSADSGTSASGSRPSSSSDPDDDHAESQRAADSDSDSDSTERTRSPLSADEDTPNGPSPETGQADGASAGQPTVPPPTPGRKDNSEQSQEDTTDSHPDSAAVPPASTSPTPTPSGDDNESGSTGLSPIEGGDETTPASSPPQSASDNESGSPTSSASTPPEDDEPVLPSSPPRPTSDDEPGPPAADSDSDETSPDISPTAGTEDDRNPSPTSAATQIPSPPSRVGPGLVPAGDAPASQDPGVVDIDEHVLNEIGSHAVAHDGEVGHGGQEVYATLYCDDQGLIRHSHIVEDEHFLEQRRSSISFKQPFYQYLQYLAQIYQNISHRLCGDVHSHPGGIPEQSPADKTFSKRVWNNPQRNHNFIIALTDATDDAPDNWTVTNNGQEVHKQLNGHLLRIRAFAGGTNEPKQIRVHTTMGI